jgi:nucleotide-binding universal stress UspA family protein
MRILLATDGSEYSREAAAQCGELVSNLEAVSVKIITIADYVVDFDSEAFISENEFILLVQTETEKKAHEILDEAEKIVRYKNEHLQIEKEMFIGSAKELIVKDAEDWKADLIIVGSHGYGFWTRTLVGSVSDAVVHHAPCSVLVVRKDQ